jgi:hypothetical protein
MDTCSLKPSRYQQEVRDRDVTFHVYWTTANDRNGRQSQLNSIHYDIHIANRTMFTRRPKLNLSAHTQQAHLLTAGRACIPQLMRLPTGTGIFIHATGCEFYQHSSGGQKKVLTLVCGKKCALSDVSHVLRTC